MSGLEDEYVKEAFASNWIAPLGPHVTAFEQEVAAFAGAKGAVALSSGTAALHLALRLLGVGRGDIVFCSSFTFVGSVNPILYLGAVPVFIDSEPETWNMSPAALEKAFNNAEKNQRLPKAVIVVDLYGHSADMEPLLKICNRYGVPVVEDAAEALGAFYRGKACGTWGALGIYSFNGNKIITTSGGGMLVSDNEEALKKALYWATQARDPAPGYQHSEMGYNYRMSNILAAIGRGQIRVLDQRVEARHRVFQRYCNALSSIAGVSFIPECPADRCNRWLTVMTLDPERCSIKPMDMVKKLEQQNIEARPVWKPMHLQPLFKGYTYFTHADSFSISDQLYHTGICLPSGSNMTTDEQDRVIECIIRMLNVKPIIKVPGLEPV
jgi:pyridoxal phosphate-dependent aminotransferase EpsN